jgi:hypothetical protein
MQQDDLLPMCRDIPPDTQGHDLYIYVAVADTGHGMTPEEQNRVFQRFAQASPRTYGDFGGHGLGLFVSYVGRSCAARTPVDRSRYSKMLVELHGGRIQLQSTQGTGTVLRFFIRVQRATTTSPPALPELIEFPLRGVLAASSNKVGQHEDTLPLPTQKFRVLVVEVRQAALISLAALLMLDIQDNLINQRCANTFFPTVPADLFLKRPREVAYDPRLRDGDVQGRAGVRRPALHARHAGARERAPI